MVSTHLLWGESRRTSPSVEDVNCDILVIGAGTVGLTTAVAAARAGAKVVVAESERIGAGTSASTVGLASLLSAGTPAQLIEAEHGVDTFIDYLRNLDRGMGFIRSEIERAGSETLEIPVFATVEDGHNAHLLHRERFAMRAAGLNPIADDEPELPFPTRPTIRMNHSFGLQPRLYAEALGRGVLEAGGLIFEGSTLARLRPGKVVSAEFRSMDTAGVVSTATIRARAVVLATGRPTPDKGLLAARLVPTTVHVLAGDGVELDGGYYIVDDPQRPYTMRPTTRPGQIVVSGRAHVTGEDPAAAAAELQAWVRDRMPQLTLTHRWSYQCYRSYDALPLVGPVGDWAPGIYAATGFGDDHNALATAGALQLADHLVAGSPRLPWSPIHARGTVGAQVGALLEATRARLRGFLSGR